MAKSSKVHEKTVSEVRNVTADFSAILNANELLTGTPTVEEVTTTDLILSNKAVNAEILFSGRDEVGIGKGVQFSVSGGVAATTYKIKITCSTDSTPAQTVIGNVELLVNADTE